MKETKKQLQYKNSGCVYQQVNEEIEVKVSLTSLIGVLELILHSTDHVI